MNRDAAGTGDAVWLWTAITANKQAARRKLMELPWREKLRRLDAMKERQELLRNMRRLGAMKERQKLTGHSS